MDTDVFVRRGTADSADDADGKAAMLGGGECLMLCPRHFSTANCASRAFSAACSIRSADSCRKPR